MGIDKICPNATIPNKKTKLNPLSKEQKQANRNLSKKRIIIENINAKIKVFKIVKHAYRNRRKRFGLRMNLICAIVNIDSSTSTSKDNDGQLNLILGEVYLKKILFDEVANQTGKMFDPDILTVVWARRFAEYKRPGLLKYDFERFEDLITRSDKPIQIIWAGKPYPHDTNAINLFNELTYIGRNYKNVAVLIGYELDLSAMLKKGADIWLNTPRITREASGTSGMSAAMNGAVNFSVADGWHPEFSEDDVNSFTILGADASLSIEEQDRNDNKSMMDRLENEIIPMYYNNPKQWGHVMVNSMNGVLNEFDSGSMAHKYYEQMYKF